MLTDTLNKFFKRIKTMPYLNTFKLILYSLITNSIYQFNRSEENN